MFYKEILRKRVGKTARYFFTALFLSVCFGCEKEIELKVNNIDKNLVIEGYVTNEPGPYYIRVTRTGDYYTPNVFEGVPNATLVLTETGPDGIALVDTLSVTDSLFDYGINGKKYGGFYRTNKITQSRARSVYHLKVVADGKTYEATSGLPDYIFLDTVLVRYVPVAESALRKKGFYITAVGKEPDTLGNNYRLKAYRNDSLLKQPDYLIGDDKLVNGLPIIRELPWNFQDGDTVSIELLALNTPTFKFYQGLSRQLFAGSPFAPPGENVKGNISGGAMGFFAAYCVNTHRLRIKKP